jgi:acetolactate synthase-1/2/3 large subunit
MLMANEVSTAVAAGAHAVWIVLNDARQGIVAQAMALQGLDPAGTEIPPVDFAAFARSLGADGERVLREADLAPALERALAAGRPWVVDVAVDRDELSPMVRQRVSSLRMQGAVREGAR